MVRRNSNINIQSQLDAVNALVAQANASALSASAVATGTATQRPNRKPTFAIDFANNRFIQDRVKSGFIRSTTGTTINRHGFIQTIQANEPRFVFDPITRESLGLLLEETRTNLLTYSNDFTQTYWAKTRATVSVNSVVSPDPTFQSYKIVEDNTISSTHQLSSSSVNAVAGTPLTGSIFLKAGERTFANVQLLGSAVYGGTTPNVLVNLLTGAVLSNVNTSYVKVIPYRNGWFRVCLCSIAQTSGNTAICVQLGSSSSTFSYDGDNVSGLYAFGAMIETGMYESSIIYTSGSTSTRNTDLLSISGSLFSEIFDNPTQGTLFISAQKSKLRLGGNYRNYHRLRNSISGENISVTDHESLSRVYSEIYVGGVQQYFNSLYTLTAGDFFNHCLGYNTNDVKDCFNTVQGLQDSVVTIPVTNTYILGGEISTIVKSIAFFNTKLSDVEMLALTTNQSLVGKSANQLPTNGELKGCAYLSVAELLGSTGKQEIPVDGTGANFTRIVRRPYPFYFEVVESTGASFSSQPPYECQANTDYTLTFNAPVGRTILYSVTKKFD